LEHRWGHRVDVAIPVRLHALSRMREKSAQLTNISISGGWIPIDIGVRRLSRIQVVFELPLLPTSPQTVNAYVARQSGEGIGLEWCEHAPQAVVRLMQALAQRHHTRPSRDVRGVDSDSADFDSYLTVP